MIEKLDLFRLTLLQKSTHLLPRAWKTSSMLCNCEKMSVLYDSKIILNVTV